jgi:hypothetical protein
MKQDPSPDFDHLVLPESHRHIVLHLVKQHFVSNNSPPTGRGHSNMIHNKGTDFSQHQSIRAILLDLTSSQEAV